MTVEIEHAPGTSMANVKIAEMEFRKDCLAKAFGWEREKLDDMINVAKEFFELNKKEILRKI